MPGATGFGATGKPATGQPAASASRTARVSGHNSAGRTGCPAASISTTPCIWPEKPIAATCSRSAGGSRAAARTSACHHTSGAISAQPGCGEDNA
ncbi:hypothetical protein BamMEX5DRAFT_6131 [Burkholderia ambifaria MEX-5]|uniref:Uncharacterized protein n=1 Tax=Burkholderia ambifaria MEX-5 TaxID=396597 RepID=B1TEB5_9BURK|nr:hypothetical protein BamMEX5DRAFT_6131 [Burkholderia ambifaria MEX-5]